MTFSGYFFLNGIAISWSGPPSLPGLGHPYFLNTCPNLLKMTFSGYRFPSRNTKKHVLKGNPGLSVRPPYSVSLFSFSPPVGTDIFVHFSCKCFPAPNASFFLRSFVQDLGILVKELFQDHSFKRFFFILCMDTPLRSPAMLRGTVFASGILLPLMELTGTKLLFFLFP